MRRILSRKVLEFNVPIPVIRQGAPVGSRTRLKKDGERNNIAQDTYINTLRTYAKANIVEQGWEMNGTDPLFIVAVLNICPLKYKLGKKDVITGKKPCISYTDVDCVRSKKLAVNKPDLDRFSKILFKALKGVVFERTSQVVAMTMMRRYNTRDGLDLLVVSSKDWSELIHDLRNA